MNHIALTKGIACSLLNLPKAVFPGFQQCSLRPRCKHTSRPKAALLARSHQELRGRSAHRSIGPVSDLITRRRNSVFGHIARLSEDTPAHKALRCHVDLTLGRLPDQSWKRRPGRPNNRWIDQLRRDNSNMPPADLWRRSTTRGHSGARRYGPRRLRVDDDDDDDEH